MLNLDEDLRVLIDQVGSLRDFLFILNKTKKGCYGSKVVGSNLLIDYVKN